MNFYIKIHLSNGDEVHARSEGPNQAEAWSRLKSNREFLDFIGNQRITSYVITPADQPAAEPSDVYELYVDSGRVMIRRNKPPRFTGVVTMGVKSDIEDIKFEDKASALEMASALRKSVEFLRKKSK